MKRPEQEWRTCKRELARLQAATAGPKEERLLPSVVGRQKHDQLELAMSLSREALSCQMVRSAGWYIRRFKLKNIQADVRFIRNSAAISFMNNPEVHIDRLTGCP